MEMNTTRALSSVHRAANVARLADQTFDLIIIGGGITGAGIALDAASRGLSTVLFEKQDFAAGTSSRSTKLIHGGLRYLKQLEVSLVREVGLERATLYQNAPHIVRPKKMLLPIIKEGSLGKYSTSMALSVYDYLASVARSERRSMHDRETTLAFEPLLRSEIVEGGGLYWEYQTDDARLTIEVLKTAANYGAQAFNYTEIQDFIYSKNKVIGVKAFDHIQANGFNVYGKKIVNAAGPWVDDLRKKDNSLKGKYLHLTKGVHIVVPYERLPLKQAVYFDVYNDKRMMFAIPKGNITYLGTTDTTYTDQIERPQATLGDVQYILKGTNYMFPEVDLTLKDVQSSWAGLRPLIHAEGKSPSELSRKDELFHSKSGLISIAGGKLTGFRKMAERAVDVVVKELFKESRRTIKECITDNIVIGGGKFKSPKAIPDYIDQVTQEYSELGIQKEQVAHLVYKYGRYTKTILSIFEDVQQKRTDITLTKQLLLAELQYGVQHEMVTSICDFLIRRTGRLYFQRPDIEGENMQSFILKEIAQLLPLSPQKQKEYLSDFEEEFNAVVNF